ncbi:MAG: HAMP domain-containing protein, partial [Delftia sp.]|nr:HAMP domain-containing protein [Delftia sp.]
MKRPNWKRTANSLRTFSPFWRAAAPRALIETFLMGAVLTASLASTRDQMPQDVIDEGFFFVGPTCALCYALRLRMPDTGRLWRRLVHEGVAGIGFGLLLGGSLLAVMYSSPDFEPLDAAFLLIVDALAWLIFRVGAWLWRFWDQVRRKRLLWALTHAHLTLVVLMMLFLAVLSVSGDIVDPEPRLETGNRLVSLVVLFNHIILPLLSLMTILTAGMLLVALPPSAILSYFVARRTTRRLESLAAATQALRGGDLAARVRVVGEDEVAQLQDDFNVMAAELERAADEVRAEQDKVASLLQSRRELFA